MKLHLCCGARIEPGWTNLDADPPADIRHDVRLGLPFKDASVSRIYCEHALEHFTAEQGLALMRECWRVLEPSGCLRFSTPDLRKLASLYQESMALSDARREPISNPLHYYAAVGFVVDTPAQLLNQGMRRWGHLYLYDELELSILFKAAGFRVYRRAKHQQTTIPDMILEGRPDCGELIMEATKGDRQ